MKLEPWIHFCVDDVIKVFQEVYVQKPKSIFEHVFFKSLQELHETYGVNVTLYVFEHNTNFYLHQLQEEYWEELRINTWIRYGWHREQGGVLPDDVQAEIASCRRVTKLLISHFGKAAIDPVGCGHRYHVVPELQKELAASGVTTLLVGDKADDWQHLLPKQVAFLENNHWCPSIPEPVAWKIRDFFFDKIETKEDVKQAINTTKTIMKEYVVKDIEIFFNEWKFMKNPQSMMTALSQYFQAFTEEQLWEKLRVPMYPDACCIVGDILYFLCKGDDNLFSLDLKTGKIAPFVKMLRPLSYKAGNMFNYGDKLYIVPYMGLDMLIVNLITREISSYRLPGNAEAARHFAFSIQEEEMVWILAYEDATLIRFNMKVEEHTVFKDIANLIFEKTRRFVSLVRHRDWIYLFPLSGEGTGIVRFHTKTQVTELWKNNTKIEYGVVYENVLYGVVKEDKKVYLKAIDFQTGNETNRLEISGIEESSYPYMKGAVQDNRLYFAPFYENSLLEIDTKTWNFSKIPLAASGYISSLCALLNYSVLEIYKYNKKIVLLPNCNNLFSFVDTETKMLETVALTQNAREYYKARARLYLFNKGIKKEEETFSLNDLIEFCKQKRIETEQKQNEIGKEIFRCIL